MRGAARPSNLPWLALQRDPARVSGILCLRPEQRCRRPICIPGALPVTMANGVEQNQLKPFYTATEPLAVWMNQANFRYEVARYQREYEWDETQVKG